MRAKERSIEKRHAAFIELVGVFGGPDPDERLCKVGRGGPCPAIDHVAGACVERLDPLRAPLTDAERARRRPERLDAAARARLERWGYPHVFEGFRFHITLTGRLDPAEAEALRPVLAERFAPHIAGPFALDALCLFGDPGARENGTGGDGGAGFRLLRHHALAV
ncbi:MAG: DUF1045 domain-containing protein [Pseudomonadota bacterium]